VHFKQRWLDRLPSALLVLLFLSGTVSAQSSTATQADLSSIEGTVRDERGLPLEASLSASSFALTQRTFSTANGAFKFSNLKAGTYVICGRVSDLKVAPESPFVDSCAWRDASSLVVRLTPNNVKNNVVLTLKHGYLLKVRVNDPQKLLAPATGRFGGSQVSLSIAGPSAILQHIPMVNQDSTGRDHAIVIPFDTPHKLQIHTTNVVLKDSKGLDVDDSTIVNVNVPQVGPTGSYIYNVDRVKP
jgi:hypothetical protein